MMTPDRQTEIKGEVQQVQLVSNRRNLVHLFEISPRRFRHFLQLKHKKVYFVCVWLKINDAPPVIVDFSVTPYQNFVNSPFKGLQLTPSEPHAGDPQKFRLSKTRMTVVLGPGNFFRGPVILVILEVGFQELLLVLENRGATVALCTLSSKRLHKSVEGPVPVQYDPKMNYSVLFPRVYLILPEV